MPKTIERPSFRTKEIETFKKAEAGGGGGGGTRRGGGNPWDKQPVGPPPDGTDRSLLEWMLRTIENELYRFVHGRESFFPGTWRSDFQEVWPRIERCFRVAHLSLERKSPAVQRELVLSGLNGDMLNLKTERLSTYINVFRESLGELSILNPQPRPIGPIEKIKDLVFGVINSLLGSLAKAFPVLEAVKEYKEHLELSVKAVELKVAE